MNISAGERKDPIAEARDQWERRYPAEPEQALRVGVITSVMRVQQLLLARVEAALRPFNLTFASYEALQLLAFTRQGLLPLSTMVQRLMVHPATVTNTIDRLEQRHLVVRQADPGDGRRRIAVITPQGRELVREATTALHAIGFGLHGLEDDAMQEAFHALTTIRREVEAAEGEPAPVPARER